MLPYTHTSLREVLKCALQRKKKKALKMSINLTCDPKSNKHHYQIGEIFARLLYCWGQSERKYHDWLKIWSWNEVTALIAASPTFLSRWKASRRSLALMNRHLGPVLPLLIFCTPALSSSTKSSRLDSRNGLQTRPLRSRRPSQPSCSVQIYLQTFTYS